MNNNNKKKRKRDGRENRGIAINKDKETKEGAVPRDLLGFSGKEKQEKTSGI
jgi:hypothetical protein